MTRGLREIGIEACIIGRALGEGVRLTDGTIVEPPDADEIYKVIK